MSTQRLTIREAAEHLGLSDNTIRRRLKDGQLRGEQEENAQGFRWHVLIDHEGDPPTQEPTQTANHEDATVNQAVNQPPTRGDQAMIEHLEGEIEYLRDQLATTIRQAAAERERADVLQREALQRIVALSAGTHEAVERPVSETPSESESTGGEEHNDSGSIWERWRRWFRGE